METFAICHLAEEHGSSHCRELLLVKNKEEYSNPGQSEDGTDTMLKYTRFQGKNETFGLVKHDHIQLFKDGEVQRDGRSSIIPRCY